MSTTLNSKEGNHKPNDKEFQIWNQSYIMSSRRGRWAVKNAYT